MNPFGQPVNFPLAPNGNSADEEKPHLTAIIYQTWYVVYSWPAQPEFLDFPRQMTLGAPSKLEAVLFGCRCREDIADKLYPVKVYTEKTEVQPCQLINEESQVAEALDLTNCECRSTPLGDKFAALPINENMLLHYQRHPNVVYTPANPNTCLLLFKNLPSSIEMDYAIEGMDIAKRSGDVTFKIKQE